MRMAVGHIQRIAFRHDFRTRVVDQHIVFAVLTAGEAVVPRPEQLVLFGTPDDTLEQIDISMEISSEFPFSNDVWPSDITFTLNGTELGTWTSPGDFADTRGKLNPSWWPSNLNQYGLLKTLRVTHHGTYMDGDPLSQVSISDLNKTAETWEIRIEVKPDAENVGGVTLFGKKFGNHDQDINFKVYYS